MPADAKLQFQTNTRTEGKNGGHVSGTDWSNKGEFSFSFWAALYADMQPPHSPLGRPCLRRATRSTTTFGSSASSCT